MQGTPNKFKPIFQGTIFFAMAAVCIFLYMLLSKHKEKTDTQISAGRAMLDSLSITRWDIIPNGNLNQEYTVFKDSNVWRIRLQDHEIVDADLPIVVRSLRHFYKLDSAKSIHLDKSKWKQEGIDDNGSEVVVYEGEKVVAKYIIGKIEFLDQYKSSYYIRPVHSDSVYLVKEVYLGGSILAPDQNFRKRAMAPVDPYYYKSVKVVSPDTNVYYLLENVKGTWSTSGRNIDQFRVLTYIKMLSLLQIPEFTSKQIKNPPEASITIDTKFGIIQLYASTDPEGKWVMGSSVNVGNRIELTRQQINAIFPTFHFFMNN